MPKDQRFKFGLFFGFAAAILISIIVLASNGLISLQDEGFKNDFALFRGIAIFIFYLWILALNVYGWEKNNIDYRHILKFNPFHYSSYPKVSYFYIQS